MRLATEILKDIFGCYLDLSPESLWCDGEASPEEARAKARRINARLQALFVEYGCEVSEEEAFRAYKELGLRYR